MRIKQRHFLELICIFVITLMFSLVFKKAIVDDIWNYGFTYNISNGLIPYKDFNMVTTPLFPILGALFLIIFGKNIVCFYIFHAIICTIIFWYMKKSNNKSYYLPYLLFLLIASPNYNILCLLFLYIILDLEKNNKNDYLIGALLGLTFITKQSIGLCLCLPTLFLKDLNKTIKRVVGFILPIIILLIYLIYNDALYQFINYCFLGLSEFGTNNQLILIVPIAILIISICYLLLKYIKTKDYKILYLICFFGMSLPIIDGFHVLIPFIATFNYFLSNLRLNKKIISIAFVLFIGIYSIYNIYIYYTSDKITYPNITKTYKYNKLDKDDANAIVILSNRLKKSDKNTFLINSSGYILKLEASIPIGKYDMLLTGNSGKDGTNVIINNIKNICENEKCSFWVNESSYETTEYNQYDKKLHEYIVNNYNKYEDVLGITIYRNY